MGPGRCWVVGPESGSEAGDRCGSWWTGVQRCQRTASTQHTLAVLAGHLLACEPSVPQFPFCALKPCLPGRRPSRLVSSFHSLPLVPGPQDVNTTQERRVMITFNGWPWALASEFIGILKTFRCPGPTRDLLIRIRRDEPLIESSAGDPVLLASSPWSPASEPLSPRVFPALGPGL